MLSKLLVPLSALDPLLIDFLDELREDYAGGVELEHVESLSDEEKLGQVLELVAQQQVQVGEDVADFALILGANLAVLGEHVAFELLHDGLDPE